MPSITRIVLTVSVVVAVLVSVWTAWRTYAQNAPSRGGQSAAAAFDNESNGFDQNRAGDQKSFEDVEFIHDGLGPVFNAQSCRECHQNPVSGGASQVAEKRAGHLDDDGDFVDATVTINSGRNKILNRNLINDRSICPGKAVEQLDNGSTFTFDNQNESVQEIVPIGDAIRTNRLSLNVLGDGFVEAIADNDIRNNAVQQCKQKVDGIICGHFIEVPVLESAPGDPDKMVLAVGRFGWKDQHASLLSFSADAYLNEMGITNRLLRDEVTAVCNPPHVDEPNDKQNDIDKFAAFMRDTKTPPRDLLLLKDPRVQAGEQVFKDIRCDACHKPSWQTSKRIEAMPSTRPEVLVGKTIFPYSDFLLHDVGTGDGIAVSITEHYGVANGQKLRALTVEFNQYCEDARNRKAAGRPGYDYCNMHRQMQDNANRLRTAPLWGLRTRSRLMHDGASLNPVDAILRHAGEATKVTERFNLLSGRDREDLLLFLKSL